MININLLPPELKLKRLNTKRNASIVSVCAVVIFFFIVLGIIASFAKGTVNDYLASIKKNVDSTNNQTAEAKNIQNMAFIINDRSLTYNDISKKRAIWSQILADLSADVPVNVQFESLTANTEKSPNFTLQGNTTTERDIIKFREKLESSPFFKNVTFKNSSLNKDQKAQTEKIKFTLEFELEKFSIK